MSHVRRLGMGAMMMVAIAILGLVLDTAVAALLKANYEQGVRTGPFAPVVEAVQGVAFGTIVPIMFAGVIAWIVYGAIKEERREEQRRRVR